MSFNIGKVITEVKSPQMGYKYLMDGKYYGHKRCMICGDWFHWEGKEMFHCGKTACEDYSWRMLKHQAVKSDIYDTQLKDFFNNPQVVKQILRQTNNIKNIRGVLF